MNILINFADDNFSKKQKLNSFTGKYIGGFDKVYEFSPSDIDPGFYQEHKSILNQKRGCGYWLWKPYFILKVMDLHNDGDIVFYCDSGSFFIRPFKYLRSVLERNKNDVLLFELPLIEFEWTNDFLIRALDLNEDKYRYTNQISATYICVKNSNQSKAFVQKYLSLCTKQEFITDEYTVKDGVAFDHRHDQSILSLLAKMENIAPNKDPSDYGRFPFKYFSKKRAFKINEYFDTYPVILLSNRKANPIIYFIKYILKTIVNRQVSK